MDNLGENHFLTTNGLNFGLYSSFSLEIYLFVGFFRFRKELGRTAATPNTTNSFPKEFSPPGKEQKPNTNSFATAPRVSVLLRCTVTGCSWFPDLVCCSNKLFSTKRPKLRQQSTANPGPAARYGALGTHRPLPSGLIKSRVAFWW